MQQFKAWLIARLQEPSGVVGAVTAVATLGGWALAPEKVAAIASIAGLVASAVAFATHEAPKNTDKDPQP